MRNPANIKRNDIVKVMAGKDKGKQGKVLKVLPAESKVIVENVNIAKKHQKPNPLTGKEGGIIEKPMPIHVSNVRAICPKCGQLTFFRRKTLEDGRRVRYCKKCGEIVD